MYKTEVSGKIEIKNEVARKLRHGQRNQSNKKGLSTPKELKNLPLRKN